MGFLKNCSFYLKLILVFSGNNQEFNSYENEMQIQSFFTELCLVGGEGMHYVFLVNDVLVEGVDNVRSAVFTHFSSHFSAQSCSPPQYESTLFSILVIYRRGVFD